VITLGGATKHRRFFHDLYSPTCWLDGSRRQAQRQRGIELPDIEKPGRRLGAKARWARLRPALGMR
jgi:hypothetical protein